MDGRWPPLPGFEERCQALMAQAHALGRRVVALLEPLACPHLPPGTLAAAHTLWAPGGQCTLRLLHYPPVEAPEAMPPGYWRAGPHTDWCSVTMLFQRAGEPGLECAANPRVPAHSGWIRVDPVAGGITINIGDMLSRWSNGRVLSNLHRVRMPTGAEATPPRSRFSFAFFMQADRETLVVSVGHAPITAGDYILGRVRSNFAPPPGS
jgi:isopenicillin N synthase-like dioxygenase